MRVLIVEDDEKIASFVAKGLKQNGFAVDHATHGEEGLDLATAISYDAAILGLQSGGDDYLTKPFAFSELLARIQALIRRAGQGGEPTTLSLADLTINLVSREVTRGEQKIELQQREFALLEYLLRNAGRPVTKTMILERLWDFHFDPQTNVVDVLVHRLRAKVDKNFALKLIHTIRGVGYVIKAAE
jgi:DNA-binding response OmpR family regulator